MKKLLGIVVLGLLWCNISFAVNFNWKKVSTSQNNTSAWYYDKKTIFKIGIHKYFWQLTDYLDDADEENSVITYTIVNCDTYESKWIIYASYSGQMGRGQLLDDFIVPEFKIELFKWEYYDPKETMQGAVLKKVCNTR